MHNCSQWRAKWYNWKIWLTYDETNVRNYRHDLLSLALITVLNFSELIAVNGSWSDVAITWKDVRLVRHFKKFIWSSESISSRRSSRDSNPQLTAKVSAKNIFISNPMIEVTIMRSKAHRRRHRIVSSLPRNFRLHEITLGFFDLYHKKCAFHFFEYFKQKLIAKSSLQTIFNSRYFKFEIRTIEI